jgi:hypothetical protein
MLSKKVATARGIGAKIIIEILPGPYDYILADPQDSGSA